MSKAELYKCGHTNGGGSFPYTVGRVQHGYDVRPDLCATDCDKTPRSFLGE